MRFFVFFLSVPTGRSKVRVTARTFSPLLLMSSPLYEFGALLKDISVVVGITKWVVWHLHGSLHFYGDWTSKKSIEKEIKKDILILVLALLSHIKALPSWEWLRFNSWPTRGSEHTWSYTFKGASGHLHVWNKRSHLIFSCLLSECCS